MSIALTLTLNPNPSPSPRALTLALTFTIAHPTLGELEVIWSNVDGNEPRSLSYRLRLVPKIGEHSAAAPPRPPHETNGQSAEQSAKQSAERDGSRDGEQDGEQGASTEQDGQAASLPNGQPSGQQGGGQSGRHGVDPNRPQGAETKSEQDDAAAKVQATWRGNRVRGRMGAIKPGLPGRPRLVKDLASKIPGKELASKLPGVQKRNQHAEDMRVLMLQAQLDKLRALGPQLVALYPRKPPSHPHARPFALTPTQAPSFGGAPSGSVGCGSRSRGGSTSSSCSSRASSR